MKVKMMKRLFSLSLSLMLVAAIAPINARGAEQNPEPVMDAVMEMGGTLESEMNTGDPTGETVTPRAALDLTVTFEDLNFGSVTYGYSAPAAKKITIKNNDAANNASLTIALNNTNFELKNYISPLVLTPGNTHVVEIQPKAGLAAGSYPASVVVSDPSGFRDEKAANFTVNKVIVVPEVDQVESKDYDTKKDAEGTLTLKAKETADEAVVTNSKPTATGKFTFVSADAGKNKEVDVTGITLGNAFTANFELSETKLEGAKSTAEIAKVDQPDKPKKVTIKSKTHNSITVKVTKGQEYSVDGGDNWQTKSKFTDLNANTNYTVTTRIAATTNYKASKKADWKTAEETTDRAPTVASTTNNTITGITANSTYKINTTLSFGAKGAGMENTSPDKDDIRYVPVSWKVGSSSGTWTSWTGTTCSASFSISSSGSNTLEVTFRRQVYDGSAWKDSDVTDVKSITFMTSTTGITQTSNNTNTNTNTNSNKDGKSDGKTAAKTGDSTPIIMLCVLLLLSAGVIAIYVVKRKKAK